MKHDVIVIGGSYAGMAAALQLVRAHCSVLVVDDGRARNRFARTAHGFLGHDGADPADIARKSREQLAAYPTLRWVEATAEEASGERDAFVVTTSDGAQHDGRRLLFATGVSDILPAVDGLAERWGKSVFHCPYCHGYELDRGAIGCIATSPISLHQAQMLSQWGKVTLFLDGALALDVSERAELDRFGVTVEEMAIARLEGEADVRLADGRLERFAGLFTVARNVPASPIAERLGCIIEETPFGTAIRTDATKATTVPGSFACGDVARVPHSLSLAVADGAWAGAQIHHSLVFGNIAHA